MKATAILDKSIADQEEGNYDNFVALIRSVLGGPLTDYNKHKLFGFCCLEHVVFYTTSLLVIKLILHK